MSNIIKKSLSPFAKIKGFFDRSLVAKLVAVFLIVALLPTFIILSMNTVQNANQTSVVLSDSTQSLAVSRATAMNQLIKEYTYLVQSVSAKPSMQRLAANLTASNFTAYQDVWPAGDLTNGSLYTSYSKGTPDYIETLASFKQITSLYPEVTIGRFFGPTGDMIVGASNGVEISADYRGDKIWFNRTMNPSIVPANETLLSAININRFSGEGGLRIMKPITYNGVRFGLVALNFNLDTLFNIQTEEITFGGKTVKASPIIIDAAYETAEGSPVGGAVVIHATDYISLEFDEAHPFTSYTPSFFAAHDSGENAFLAGQAVLSLKGTTLNYLFAELEIMIDNVVSHAIMVGYVLKLADLTVDYVNIVASVIFITLIVTVAVAIVAVFMSRYLAKLLAALHTSSNALADADLSVRVSDDILRRKDEIGVLGRDFSGIQQSLVALVDPIMRTTVQLNGFMQQLSLASGEAKNVSTESTESFTEILSGVNYQAEQNNDVAKSITEHNNLVQRLTGQVVETLELVREINDEITFIALNAQIEAARVGSVGRGFMVVASSIKDLARNTKEQLKNLQASVAQINENVKTSVDGIQINVESLGASAEEIASISANSETTLRNQIEMFIEMANTIQRLSGMTNEIQEILNVFRMP